ncbi:PRKCA-binding protein isoform X2, partial [Ixodes scapularis]
SYCLRVKEMDDEEYAYQALQEPLYRVETGNYEYRLILRCRQDARVRFAKLRSDVLVKLELLDQKHVQDIVFQLQRLVSALSQYHNDCHAVMKTTSIFPIEVDLSRSTFHYADPSVSPYQDEEEEDRGDDDDDELLEAQEMPPGAAGDSLLSCGPSTSEEGAALLLAD